MKRLVSNNTYCGLSARVWSANIDTCMAVARGVRTGTDRINTFMEGYPELPFGGYKQPGAGREFGKRAVEDDTEEKGDPVSSRPVHRLVGGLTFGSFLDRRNKGGTSCCASY